ncbi:hypothetical protein RESH_04811 [Rhodopirellula europaea SH398]|uniref:Uncharacterized protein n=1 Tax=Rhodopirellula europaea SH398 TaxID=1263868 RepID=M5RYR7_9BACT|nr:hypothetical protein RESH_04811 [Rhodopirellula europaea SH398]
MVSKFGLGGIVSVGIHATSITGSAALHGSARQFSGVAANVSFVLIRARG